MIVLRATADEIEFGAVRFRVVDLEDLDLPNATPEARVAVFFVAALTYLVEKLPTETTLRVFKTRREKVIEGPPVSFLSATEAAEFLVLAGFRVR